MASNPKRTAALRAAAKAACFGERGEDCDRCAVVDQCTHWRDHLGSTRAAVAAYQRAMGRDLDARQVEEARDE